MNRNYQVFTLSACRTLLRRDQMPALDNWSKGKHFLVQPDEDEIHELSAAINLEPFVVQEDFLWKFLRKNPLSIILLEEYHHGWFFSTDLSLYPSEGAIDFLTQVRGFTCEQIDSFYEMTNVSITVLHNWYARNWDDPFPSLEQIYGLSIATRLPVRQILKWLYYDLSHDPRNLGTV